MPVGILDGLPAGMPLTERDLALRMARRRAGCGRGNRMTFDADRPQLVGGTWKGVTTGAPPAVLIENRSNRQGRTTVRKTVPRPGHADLAGMLKYGLDDASGVIERASARETAVRVALGVCRLLELCGARRAGRVIEPGGVDAKPLAATGPGRAAADRLERARDISPVAAADPRASQATVARIDGATARGETLGGRVALIVWGLPPGLGSYVQHDRRLDARLAAALDGMASVKGSSWAKRWRRAAPFAPWEIQRADLDSDRVRVILERLARTGRLVVGGKSEQQYQLFP